MAQQDLDYHKALQDPRAAFGWPERVLADPRLDREGKRAILKNWEQDERELAIAEEKGMGGGERNMLQRVRRALEAVSEGEVRCTPGVSKRGGDGSSTNGSADD
jgi:hypothetical protein